MPVKKPQINPADVLRLSDYRTVAEADAAVLALVGPQSPDDYLAPYPGLAKLATEQQLRILTELRLFYRGYTDPTAAQLKRMSNQTAFLLAGKAKG